MSTPLPKPWRSPAGTRNADAKALFTNSDEALLEVKINIPSTLEWSLRESLDALEQS